MKNNKSSEKSDIVIICAFAVLSLIIGVLFYMMNEEIAELRKREKDRLIQPIINLYNGFIEVQEMNCNKITETFTKRQLSKLTDEEKWLVKDSTECGVTFEHVRWRKDGILGYYPHFSLELWRNDEDANDPGAPLHVKKINVENCKVALKNTPGEVKLVVIEGKCSLLDEVLR